MSNMSNRSQNIPLKSNEVRYDGWLYKSSQGRRSIRQKKRLFRILCLSDEHFEEMFRYAKKQDMNDKAYSTKSNRVYCLAYWKPSQKCPVRVISLYGCEVRETTELEIANAFTLITRSRKYFLQTDTNNHKDEWVDKLNSLISPTEQIYDHAQAQRQNEAVYPDFEPLELKRYNEESQQKRTPSETHCLFYTKTDADECLNRNDSGLGDSAPSSRNNSNENMRNQRAPPYVNIGWSHSPPTYTNNSDCNPQHHHRRELPDPPSTDSPYYEVHPEEDVNGEALYAVAEFGNYQDQENHYKQVLPGSKTHFEFSNKQSSDVVVEPGYQDLEEVRDTISHVCDDPDVSTFYDDVAIVEICAANTIQPDNHPLEPKQNDMVERRMQQRNDSFGAYHPRQRYSSAPITASPRRPSAIPVEEVYAKLITNTPPAVPKKQSRITNKSSINRTLSLSSLSLKTDQENRQMRSLVNLPVACREVSVGSTSIKLSGSSRMEMEGNKTFVFSKKICSTSSASMKNFSNELKQITIEDVVVTYPKNSQLRFDENGEVEIYDCATGAAVVIKKDSAGETCLYY